MKVAEILLARQTTVQELFLKNGDMLEVVLKFKGTEIPTWFIDDVTEDHIFPLNPLEDTTDLGVAGVFDNTKENLRALGFKKHRSKSQWE